ncbi:MAG: hypothetical protein ABIS84_03210 [Arachnia sp.]
MLGSLLTLAFWVLPVASALIVVATLSPTEEPTDPRPYGGALLLWLLVAIPSLLERPFPVIYDVLRRDATYIASGQVWRLFTSPLVQMGGISGTRNNLFALAVVATAAVAYWGVTRTWVVFWFGGVASNIAVLGLRPVGGGNSMAHLVLATALVSSVLVDSRRRPLAVAFAVVVLAFAVVMVITRNYHAVSCGIGLVVGLFPWLRRPAPSASMSER